MKIYSISVKRFLQKVDTQKIKYIYSLYQQVVQLLLQIFLVKRMSEISNYIQDESVYHQQVACQQQTMISVLKEEILRLQEQIVGTEQSRDEYAALYEKALEEIHNLKDKISALRENNESLIQTFQVFQRQFINRDYNNVFSQLKEQKKTTDGPFFMELIRNMKTKFTLIPHEPLKLSQRSYLSDYYGFFFHSDVEEDQLELYQQVQSSKKIRMNKIRSFGRKKFFNQKFRHTFWFNSIENSQKITYKLYEVLNEALVNNQENKLPPNSIIDLDLRRMDLKVDEQKSQTMKSEIKRVLELFSLYRPDIGYVQGMSYFAWMLLIRMESYQSFVCFSNIMLNDPFIHSLYMFKKEKINMIVSFYQQCLEDKKPKLFKHMKRLQVEPELFIIEWAYTFFSRAFNLRIVSKIWDLWFSEGFNSFFKVTMAIMQMLEAEILEQKQNDRIIEILRTQTLKLDENQFLKHLIKQKLFEDLKLTDFKK